jgi:hypothetical protein
VRLYFYPGLLFSVLVTDAALWGIFEKQQAQKGQHSS